MTTPPPTAPECATTSTWSIWPGATSPPSTGCGRTPAWWPTTSAPAGAIPCWRWWRLLSRPRGGPFPTALPPAGRGMWPAAMPTPTWPAGSWAGRPSSAWATWPGMPGTGSSRTPTATADGIRSAAQPVKEGQGKRGKGKEKEGKRSRPAARLGRGEGSAGEDDRGTVAKQALVGGDAHLGTLDLAVAGLAAQLPGQLTDLGQRLGGHGLARTGQPPRSEERRVG